MENSLNSSVSNKVIAVKICVWEESENFCACPEKNTPVLSYTFQYIPHHRDLRNVKVLIYTSLTAENITKPKLYIAL